jgi:hypothetical protein
MQGRFGLVTESIEFVRYKQREENNYDYSHPK